MTNSMKSFKLLAASLTLVAILAGCTRERFHGGIDSSKPCVTEVQAVAVPYDGKSVTIQWDGAQAVAAGAKSFTLELVKTALDTLEADKPDNYDTSISATVQADSETSVYSSKINGQTKGNIYYIRVRANYEKSQYSEWSYLTNPKTGDRARFKVGRGIITEGVEDPYLYKVTPTSTGIIVKWDAIPGAMGYELDYKLESASDWTQVVIDNPDVTVYKLQNLPSNTTYNVKAKTIIAGGESDFCETQTVTTRQPGSYPKDMKTADELIAWLEGGVVEVEATDVYTISADIDLAGQSFTAMDESLMGTFDGQGHTISGVSSTLFFNNEGTIKNFKVKGDIKAEGSGSFAAVVLTNKGKVTDVTSSVNITVTSNEDAAVYVGGICVENAGTLDNVKNTGSIEVKQTVETAASPCVGGIASYSTGVFKNSVNDGNVKYTADAPVVGAAVAGIAGFIETNVTDCVNNGAVTLTIPYSKATAGAGYLPFIEGKTFTPATYYGTPAAAGIAAYTYSATPDKALIDACENNGAITFSATTIDKYTTTVQRVQSAGIVANPWGLVRNCTNNGSLKFEALTSTGSASGGTYLMCCGGIGGADWFVVSQDLTSYEGCVNNGDIEYTKFDKVGSSNSTCGGICGWPGAEASRSNVTKNCINNGNITFSGTGKARVGGIHGGSGAMNGCKNFGKVYCVSGDPASAIGGLAGFSSNGLTIQKSESRGPVVSDIALTSGVGGGVGNLGNSANSGKFTNCVIATKVVNGEGDNAHTGMIVGYFNGTSASTPIGASGAVKVSGKIRFGGKTTVLTAGNYSSYLTGTANFSEGSHPVTATFDSTPYVDPDDQGGEDEPAVKLEAPKNVTIAVLYNSVTVTWDAVENAEWYIVEYKKKTDDEWVAAPRVETNSCTIEGLAHGTEYNFRVKAYSSNASGFSDEVSSETLPEVILAKPVVTLSPEATVITASWGAVTGATAYAVEYKATGAEAWTSAGTVTATSKAIEGLKPKTEYAVRVKALGEGGNEGEFCDPVTVTTEEITITYPYTVTSADEFVTWLSIAATCVAGDEVILGADIDLTKQTLPTPPAFAGILNGNGKTIKIAAKEAVGLFSTISGEVKDLTIAGSVDVALSENIQIMYGTLAARSTAVIKNVTNAASVTIKATSTLACPVIAGVVGYQKGGSLSGVKNTGAISLTHAGTTSVKHSGISVNTFCEIGGVVALLESSEATGCQNDGKITVKTTNNKAVGARHYIGGVVAVPQASVIKACVNKGAIDADFSEGGVAGTNGKQVWVGGVVGGRNGDVKNADGADMENCQNYGDLSLNIDNTSNHYLAGIGGQPHCEAASGITSGETAGVRVLKGCTNYGKLTKKGVGACRLGGISGGAATIEGCENQGEIVVENIAPAGAVGGLVGYPTQDIHPVKGSKNIGKLTAKCDVAFAMGGLFGQGGNTNQNYAGCEVNCAIDAPASVLSGIVLGTAKTLASGKKIVYGTAEAPFKVKGSVKGTALTADNFTSLLASDGAAAEGVITTAASGTIDVANVQFAN